MGVAGELSRAGHQDKWLYLLAIRKHAYYTEGYQSAFCDTSKNIITSRCIVGGGVGSTGGAEL